MPFIKYFEFHSASALDVVVALTRQVLVMSVILKFLSCFDGTVLAAWMRLKYPHISIGALASSAPILQFEDIVPAETFYNLVSNDFKVCFLHFPLLQSF